MSQPTPSQPAPLPAGFSVSLDRSTRQISDSVLVGGSPMRLMRLVDRGRDAYAELLRGAVETPAAATLARRLTDTGLAHPHPPRPAIGPVPDVQVIIPARDRPELLDRCLAALGPDHPVVVVDDGSRDPWAVAEVAGRHNATVVRRPVSGGPAAARNTGLAATTSELVAFLDSDCLPTPGWVANLVGHLDDPLVGLVAPRIRPTRSPTAAGRYARTASCLDLGPRPARVLPRSRVAYVPSTALLARRTALLAVATGDRADSRGDGHAAAAVFDPALRYGEDVDLVWRLQRDGWRIRYDPAAVVEHQEPDTWRALLARRFRYGTSAAPLARRNPDETTPLVLRPWPLLTVAGALAVSPATVAVGVAGSLVATARPMRRAGLPLVETARAVGLATAATWADVGRFATQFGGPALLGVVMVGRGSTVRRRAGVAAAGLLLGAPLRDGLRARPALDPARYVLAHIADDVAYGAGVGLGCLRERTARALRPTLAWPNRRPAAKHRPAKAPAPELRTIIAATPTTTPALRTRGPI